MRGNVIGTSYMRRGYKIKITMVKKITIFVDGSVQQLLLVYKKAVCVTAFEQYVCTKTLEMIINNLYFSLKKKQKQQFIMA